MWSAAGESACSIASMLAPAHAGVLGRRGLHDREMLGRERRRARVDDLADAGDQVLADAGHRPADRDHRRVHQAHTRRQHFADVATRLSHSLDRVDVAVLDQVDDVVAVRGLDALRTQLAGDRGARGQRLEAAAVAAAARHVRAARDPHVADVARDALRAAQQLPAGDHAGADARRDLDEHQVLGAGPRGRAFAERHDVHVVVDQDRRIEVLSHPPGDVEPVPSGHDRRVDRAAGGELDRPGNADADRGDVARARGPSRPAAPGPSRASRSAPAPVRA